ncbi:MAG: hypothetical protein H6733_00280 [Alphaproteobacteria bacterium]|nr:hypothetical protein [Alphaproteobacteria bacterium]
MSDTPFPLPGGAVGWTLAAALPVAVVAGWWAWMTRPLPAEPSPIAQGFARTLASDPPRVVVLGNSIARVSLVAPQLSEALGLDGGVAKLTIDGSNSAHWYTILEHSVYEAGYAPDLVLIPNLPAYALDPVPHSPIVQVRLDELLQPGDALVRAKVRGGSPVPWWTERLTARRLDVRAFVLDGLKAASVDLVFGGDGDDVRSRGLATADPALERVFGADGAVDMDLHAAAMPIVEVRGEASTDRPITLAGSLIPDLVQLAAAHGSRVLFVRMPVLPDPEILAREPADAVADLVDLLNDAPNGGYLDLSGLPVPATAFNDTVHLNDLGIRAFMDALVAYVDEVDVLGDTPFPRARPPLVPLQVGRTGTPPPLDAPEVRPWGGDGLGCCSLAVAPALDGLDQRALLGRGLVAVSPVRVSVDGTPLRPVDALADHGDGCQGTSRHPRRALEVCPTRPIGDGAVQLSLDPGLPVTLDGTGHPSWWVYPHTAVTLTLPALEADGVLRAAWVHTAGDGATSLTVDDVAADVDVRDLRRVATATVPAGRPVTVALSSDGPFALLQALGVETDGQLQMVVGSAAGLRGLPLRLTTGAKRDEHVDVVGPALPAVADGPLQAIASGLVLWPSTALGAMGDRARTGRQPGRACNPVDVLEDGAPLPGPNTSLRDLQQGTAGYLLEPRGVLFRSSDGTDPLTNGRTYTVRRTDDLPTPRCEGQHWVHPGGTLTATHDAVGVLTGGADVLELLATTWGPDAEVHVTVSADGAPLLDVDVDTTALSGGLLRVPLQRHLPASTSAVVFTLTVPDDGPSLLLDGANLVERPLTGEVDTPDAVAITPLPAPPVHAADADATVTPEAGGLAVVTTTTPRSDGACLAPVPASGKLFLGGRITVRDVRPPDHPRFGAYVVVHWLDADGVPLRKDDDRPLTTSSRLAAVGTPVDVDQGWRVPEGATAAQVCATFVGATGTLAVAALTAEAR